MSDPKSGVDKSSSSSFEDLGVVNDMPDEENISSNTDLKEDEWLDILGSGHLMKKIIKEGDSEIRPQRNDLCRIKYEGKLKETGLVIEKEDDLEVQLGDGDVIQGIDLALPLMYDGEISELKISPRFGFGEIGKAPSIPPNAHLHYVVELISSQPEPDLETLSIQERQTIGNKKRERGNWWYSMQEPALAIQCYRRAIEYLDETKGGITDPTPDGDLEPTSNELHSLLSDRIKVYNNMAAAQMKLGTYEAALQSVDKVLSCEPNNVKALFRKGRILGHKNDVEGALKAVRAALALSPDEKSIRSELIKLEEREKKDGQKERDLAKKMLGGTSKRDKDKKSSKPKDDSSSNKKKIIFWGTTLFTVAIGVISYVVYKYKLLQ